MTGDVVTIAAGEGKAVSLERGQSIRIIEAFGAQVVDTWAFNSGDMSEFMSMSHSRSCLERLAPKVGDALYTNRRRPILSLVEDTSPGTHDTLLSACDLERYRLLGCSSDYHRNCVDNLKSALAPLGYDNPPKPDPLNLFEHVSCSADNKLRIEPPHSVIGDYVVLHAEMAVIVVMSACPMDMVPTNGKDMRPKAVQYEVL